MNRLNELDIMKFWGIILVVLGHLGNMFVSGRLYPEIQYSEKMTYMSAFIYSFHMPLFVFVSGCVYAFQCEVLNRRNTLRQLIGKKSIRLLVPYVFWGVFVMVPLMYACGLRLNICEYAYQGIILSKDCRHLWFVLMLFEVFVLFWCIDRFVELARLPKWSLLLISFMLYCVANFVPYIFQLSSTFRYQFWFVFGYVFLLYKNKIQKIIVNYTLGGVILLMYFILNHQLSMKIPFLATIVAMAGIMLFYQISCDFQGITKYKFYQIVSRNSFGIYLYHVVIIYSLFYWMKGVALSPYIICFTAFVVAMLLSVLLTELTRKLSLQILIGEKHSHVK